MFKLNDFIVPKLFSILLGVFLLSLPATAQVDNCCGIDRQCGTNDEWVSGYYAFQNNDCAAPPQQQQGQPQKQQARQQRGFLPIDNCCFSGWQCDDDEEWISGYWAFQNDHCAVQSHWEEQMRKREAQAQAHEDSGSRQQPQGQDDGEQTPEDHNSESGRADPGTYQAINVFTNPEQSEQETDDSFVIIIVPMSFKEFCSYHPDEYDCKRLGFS